MNQEIHQRACRLIDAWHVEGISPSEREWLEAHLAECPACQGHMRASERALQTLRSYTVKVDPALVSTTQARVRWRACQMRDNQARLRALWISCGLSWLMGVLTAPLLWEGLAWLGRNFDFPRFVTILLFSFCWIAPATLVGALAAWKYSRSSGTRDGAWGR